MSAIRVLEKSELSQLEAKANGHKANALKEWQAFVDTVNEIQNNQPWQEKAPDWDKYCRAIFKLSASRIRQYRAAVPYAEIIEQSTGYQPTENQIRVLREVVKDESKLIQVYKSAASLYEGQPAKRHFVASLEVLEQAESTGAVSVGGDATDVTQRTLDAATKEACEEADKRFWQHKQNGKATPIKITLKRINGAWQVNADGDLPDLVEMTYWRKDNAQS